jgi:hypothetical protein
VDFLLLWSLGQAAGFAGAASCYLLARRAREGRRRRILFGLAALLAFATAPPLFLTALFLIAYSGYCEDVGYCSPDWWAPVGGVLIAPLVGLAVLFLLSVAGFRRTPA